MCVCHPGDPTTLSCRTPHIDHWPGLPLMCQNLQQGLSVTRVRQTWGGAGASLRHAGRRGKRAAAAATDRQQCERARRPLEHGEVRAARAAPRSSSALTLRAQRVPCAVCRVPSRKSRVELTGGSRPLLCVCCWGVLRAGQGRSGALSTTTNAGCRTGGPTSPTRSRGRPSRAPCSCSLPRLPRPCPSGNSPST